MSRPTELRALTWNVARSREAIEVLFGAPEQRLGGPVDEALRDIMWATAYFYGLYLHATRASARVCTLSQGHGRCVTDEAPMITIPSSYYHIMAPGWVDNGHDAALGA